MQNKKIYVYIIHIVIIYHCGPGQLSRYSDSLRVGRSGDQKPVGCKVSTRVLTGPGAHTASCTMGTGSLQGVKRPERDVDHPASPSAEVKERVQLYLNSPSRPWWPVMGCILMYTKWLTKS